MALAEHMDIRFETEKQGAFKVYLEGEDVSHELRTEETGLLASKVAQFPGVAFSAVKAPENVC